MAALNDDGSIEILGAPTLSWAAAWRSKTAGLPCGDRHLVLRQGDVIMIAVIDGAGSGARAAQASATCHAALSALPGSLHLEDCFAAAHRACRETNGAALGVALIEPAALRLAWGAVGDIDGLLIRNAPTRQLRRESILQCGGTVGLHLPAVLCQSHRLAPGDTVIFVSDGIRQSYRALTASGSSAVGIAAEVLQNHGRSDDDAIVLAARLGEPA
jgi:hypothetical protein